LESEDNKGRTAYIDLVLATLTDHERKRTLSALIDRLDAHKANTPSPMRPTNLNPVKQTVAMVLDVVDLLSDRELDQLWAKLCLEKLRREARVQITVHGGK